MLNYLDIRPKIGTGDIVLFSEHNPIAATLQFVTMSRWSNVGLVIIIPEVDLVLLMETAPFGSINDISSGRATKDIQLTSLSTKLRLFNGDVAIRHLEYDRSPMTNITLMAFRQELRYRPYEANYIQFIKGFAEGTDPSTYMDISFIFNAELVAEAYQRLGLLTEDVPSNEYVPKDFSEDGNLILIKGKLGKEILLKYD